MHKKITPHCALSRVRSVRSCQMCGEHLHLYGLVIYRNDGTFKRYAWVHIQCLESMHPDKMPYKLQKKKSWPGRIFPCSYCGDSNPVLWDFGEFYLHEQCIHTLNEEVRHLLDKHGPVIFAESI